MESSVQAQSGRPGWRHQLAPAGLVNVTDGRRSARDWVVDIAMFAAAIAIGGLQVAYTWSDHSTLELVVDFALGTVACVAIWYRRSRPVAVAVFTLGAAVISGLAGGPGLIALFNAAIRVSRRTLVAIVALSLASTAAYPLIYPGGASYVVELTYGVLLTAVVTGWGLFARVRRELVHSLRDRAARLESEHRVHVEHAREAERRRIAREMHDVLAHRLSLLSLHAGALEFRPDAPPGQIAEAAAVVRASAHSALEELREVIGVLRDDAVTAVPEPPQPRFEQIPALVEESRAAGMPVDCHVDAPGAETLPAATSRTAYRIVQEGLTNARKHAPACAVEVAVTAPRRGRLVVEVFSRRPVGSAVEVSPLPGPGAGLIGLAERVELAGGELEHGPDAAGDFVLRATLRWTP